jgi:hypothetical protein
VVRPDTEIVIEAYPRSANTFSVAAFQMAQPRPVPVAHHLHAPIQLVEAARAGIPALGIVRPPSDVAASVTIRSPHVSLEQALEAYIRFYEPLAPYRDRCMVVPFEEVTSDFGAVIERLNGRCGTSFAPFQHTDENVRAVYALIEEKASHPAWEPAIHAYVSGRISKAELDAARNGHRADLAAVPEHRVARPSAERKARAAEVHELYRSRQLAPLRERAEATYRAFAEAD